MVTAGFVAPYLLDTTTRFVEAAARLPGVRTALITCGRAGRLPPAGAGAKSTFRLDDPGDLNAWLEMAPPTADLPAQLEEFLTGDEGSYDSVMIDGQVVWDSVSDYLPTPLEVLRHPWMQWVVRL